MSKFPDVNEFLGYGYRFQSVQMELRDEVSENKLSSFSEIGFAQNLAFSVLGSVVSRSRAMSVLEIDRAKRNQAPVIADFAKSIHAFEYCLSCGLYGPASTLLRREMEAVEAIRGIRQDTQLNERTPRLKALRHFGKSYSRLTGISHNSDQEEMDYLAGGYPANLDPKFDGDFARYLLGIHVNCVILVALQLAHLAPYSTQETMESTEKYFSEIVLGILVELKVLTPKEDSKS